MNARKWNRGCFIGLVAGSKKIALTYDDGPNDPHTLRLLEVLAQHKVPATFFMIGRYVQQLPKIAQMVAAAGHVIGNHTFTHPSFFFISELQTRVQVEECRRALNESVGLHSNLFRPPFGHRRNGPLRIVRSLGFQSVLWNVAGWDWKRTSADDVERNVWRKIRGGDVILLHDGSHEELGRDRAHSVLATHRLITRLKSEGYEFVTIPAMMGDTS